VFPPPCVDSAPILQLSENGQVPTGLEQCADGRVHRTSAIACEYPAALVGTCGGLGVPTDPCAVDADCVAAPHGYCNVVQDFASYCECHYGCETDADCGPDQLCLCDGPRSRCVAASCKTDTECEGWTCARGSEPSACGSPPAFFACQGPLDTCDAVSGCDPSSCTACLYSAEECAWACREHDEACADCGRPYLVAGRPRVAGAVARRDWIDDALAAVRRPDAITCDALADHWRRCAQMEHASVAAFARYCLDLLSLGAPPELLQAAQQAMADEVEHAQLCFSLASAYAGKPCGPGFLPSDGALVDRDRERILDDVVREGCIGETLAAAEAIEALAQAEDPVVRGVLARIAEDELRHAALAWRHVRWALEDVSPVERSRILAIVRTAVNEAARAGADPHPPARIDLLAHGVLDAPLRAELRKRVLSDVIAPSVRALSQPTIALRTVNPHAAYT
jgi:hypothetical protein